MNYADAFQQDMTRRWTTNDVLNQNSAKGWIALPESAPAWVRTYVAEARSAVLEKREIKPNLQREFIRGCEERNLLAFALRGSRPAAVVAMPGPSAAARASAEDAWLRKRLAALGEQIRAEAAKRDDDDFDEDNPFDEYDKEDHERCAESERNLARNSKSLAEGCAHYTAADAHAKAAQTGDRSDSVHAQALSAALRKKK
jgi:hypothetical protein